MSGLKQRLRLSRGEDLFWYAAGGRCALFISFGGGETPMVYLGLKRHQYGACGECPSS